VNGAQACSRCGRVEQLRRGLCHSDYERDRKAGRIESLVPARDARAHIELLCSGGWRYNEIARAARIDRTVVAFIVGGRNTVNACTASGICGIDPSDRARFVKHIDPGVAKARGRKAAASLTIEAKAARSAKIWATRRANARKRAAEAERQRFLASARRAAEQRRQRQVMAARRAETQRHKAAVGVRENPLIELAQLLAPEQDWRDDALCAQVDADLWFPEKGGPTRDAKKICMGCTVRVECLEWALDNEERFGIWGGKSERERRRLVKQAESAQESA
jgi:WhiB family redox-sensing transcriptional regulator